MEGALVECYKEIHKDLYGIRDVRYVDPESDCAKFFTYCWKNHVEPFIKSDITVSERFDLQIKLLKHENTLLKRCVEFYADEENWNGGHMAAPMSVWDGNGDEIAFKKARDCLKQLKVSDSESGNHKSQKLPNNCDSDA